MSNSGEMNNWKRMVSANVNGFNRQRDFFVNGWNRLVHKFDWLPEMFSYDPRKEGSSKTTEQGDRNKSDHI